VPADEARLSIVDAIITRVGASDLQIKGVSTFFAEMLETSCMMNTATSNSLLIIDELGRGTSTSEGYGIARAVAEYIAETIQCFCLFATHFFELTNMEGQTPKVKNYHVHAELIGTKLTMLYRLETGSINKSFGIHVMESTGNLHSLIINQIPLGFPEKLVQDARERLAQLEKANDATKSRVHSKQGTMVKPDPSAMDEEQLPAPRKGSGPLSKEDILGLSKLLSLAQKMNILKVYRSYTERISQNEGCGETQDRLMAECKNIVQEEVSRLNAVN
jgi:DNA mismatch repair ATPase MutS